ncbi:unnamed protein product [Nippostrongylus brasiliensis]|uniref:Uncharacterized protein n=1 Tax=Nippostrongylus brasiliensis TaxID=27835 RepID=A0A0N4XNC8_NIPBR|nr:unnamed protein product [Nippostrongylus brasiliensis]
MHLPRVLSADVPQNRPPSIPPTPPEPDSSPPGTSTSSPQHIVHNHAAVSKKKEKHDVDLHAFPVLSLASFHSL